MGKSFRSSKILTMLMVMIGLFELIMIAQGMEIIKIENADEIEGEWETG